MPLPSFSRPTGFAGWASGPSGAARVTEPSATEKALGWQAGVSGGAGFNNGVPPSSYFNWKWNTDYAWQKYLDDVRGIAEVGDGSDGDLILVNQTFVATRAMQIRDLALGFSGVFKPNGFPHGAHLLTGVSGVIEGIAGDGGAGRTGAVSNPGGVPAVGPLRGQTGFATTDYGTTGTSSTIYPSRAAWAGVGGAGGTGGIGAGANATLVPGGFWSNRAPTLALLSGTWKRLPQWLDGLAQVLSNDGVPTQTPVGGGAAGALGVGLLTSGGAGGAGGEHMRMNFAEVNFQGMVRSRGGRGGTGYYTGNAVGAAGGGGGGGGGSAGFGIGRKTRFDVTYDFSGGAGGLPFPAGSSGGATGLPGAIGATTAIELPLP